MSAATVRLAATVMLIRPSASGDDIEVFLLRRSGRSAFMPDAYVFPGGSVDPQDATPSARERTLGTDDARIPQGAGLPQAALRELFEESGVLLAAPESAAPLDRSAIAEARARLRDGTPFADVLAASHWYCDARALIAFSHWITPASEPRRYDTYFFVARAPHEQAASADAYETHDGRWMTPAGALDAYRGGSLHLVYPTIKHLERLAAFRDVDAVLAFAASKPIVTILPDGTREDGFAMDPSLENAW